MLLSEDITVIAGWTKTGVMRFTIKEFLYPEILADRNVYAVLTDTTAYHFVELVGLAHFKDNLEDFIKTSDAVEDIRQEKYGGISTSHIHRDGFANWEEIITYVKHSGAGVLYIEDVAKFDTEVLKEILILAAGNEIKVLLNDTSETRFYTLGLDLQTEMKHLKHSKTYGKLGAKVYVGQYKKNLEYFYLKDLDTKEVHSFNASNII